MNPFAVLNGPQEDKLVSETTRIMVAALFVQAKFGGAYKKGPQCIALEALDMADLLIRQAKDHPPNSIQNMNKD